MGAIESFAWGALFGSLVTLGLLGVAVALAVVWLNRTIKRAMWL